MTMKSCDCGSIRRVVNGYDFCTHCDTGHSGSCQLCKRYDAAVSRRLNS
jgi:hypothetical protein